MSEEDIKNEEAVEETPATETPNRSYRSN